MNTSNKLLLGMLIVILASITALLGAAKYYEVEDSTGAAHATEVPAPPTAPEPPQLPGN